MRFSANFPLNLNSIVLALFQLFYFAYGNGDGFKAELICTETHMDVYITYTEGLFSGVVYTEGSYKDPNCFREIQETSKFVFKIPFDNCKTYLENGKHTNVMVVQHHQRIMTGDDAAIKLSCAQTNVQQRAEIKVTESMKMVHKDGFDDDEFLKTKYKPYSYNKKEKTIVTDKGVMTFVNGGKNKTVESKGFSSKI